MQYAQAGELTPEQARQMIMNAQNPHPGVSPRIGHENDWVDQVFTEAYVKAYAEMMPWLVLGPLGRVAPEAAMAGKTAAEGLAIRGVNFALDPKAGFIKGLTAGVVNQLFFEGEAPIYEIPGNKLFNFGLGVGNTVGAVGAAVRGWLF